MSELHTALLRPILADLAENAAATITNATTTNNNATTTADADAHAQPIATLAQAHALLTPCTWPEVLRWVLRHKKDGAASADTSQDDDEDYLGYANSDAGTVARPNYGEQALVAVDGEEGLAAALRQLCCADHWLLPLQLKLELLTALCAEAGASTMIKDKLQARRVRKRAFERQLPETTRLNSSCAKGND
eukprot:2318171-Pleurochrysis_carterae.AAC.1